MDKKKIIVKPSQIKYKPKENSLQEYQKVIANEDDEFFFPPIENQFATQKRQKKRYKALEITDISSLKKPLSKQSVDFFEKLGIDIRTKGAKFKTEVTTRNNSPQRANAFSTMEKRNENPVVFRSSSRYENHKPRQIRARRGTEVDRTITQSDEILEPGDNSDTETNQKTDKTFLDIQTVIKNEIQNINSLKTRDTSKIDLNIAIVQNYSGYHRKYSFNTYKNSCFKQNMQKSSFHYPKANEILDQLRNEDDIQRRSPSYEGYLKRLNMVSRDLEKHGIMPEFISRNVIDNLSYTRSDTVDHVRKNADLQGKISKIKDIKLVYKNFQKEKEMRQIKISQQEADIMKRNNSIAKLQKWDNFRTRKEQIINNYIAIRKKIYKKQFLTINLIKQICLNFIVKTASSNFYEKKRLRKYKESAAKVSLMTLVKFKFKLRKHGPDMLIGKHRSYIRHALTFYTQSQELRNNKKYTYKPLKIFLDQLFHQGMVEQFQQKTKYVHDLVNFIQKKWRDKIDTQHSKVDCILQYWDLLFFQWFQIASKNKDQGMLKLLLQFKMVDKEIIKYVFKAYVTQCRQIHSVALLQWRLYFCPERSKLVTDDDIREMINLKVEEMEENAEKLKKKFYLTHETIELGAFWPIKNQHLYGLKSNTTTSFNFTKFSQVGWTDPFPGNLPDAPFNAPPKISENQRQKYIEDTYKAIVFEEKFIFQTKDAEIHKIQIARECNCGKNCIIDDLVYMPERYLTSHSPMSVYIPSKDLIFKMVRACLGCKTVEDLWIYQH